jgi:hypothetical protein
MPDDGDPADSDNDDRSRPLAAILSGVVLAAVLLAGGFAAWPRSDHSGPPAITTPAAGSDPALGRADGTDGSDSAEPRPFRDGAGCPHRRSGTSIPTNAPSTSWSLYQGGAVPSSDRDGPLVDDGIARCFSHTPTGALIASVVISYHAGLGPNRIEAARAQTVPGRGQDAMVQALEALRGSRGVSSVCQIAGYRFVSYSPREAVISLASKCEADLQQTLARVRWTAGDWKLVPEPDGRTSPTTAALPDLAGFVLWSGI